MSLARSGAPTGALLLVVALLPAARQAGAQSSGPLLVPGPVVAGNGVTDGLGATLGRVFLRLTEPDTQGQGTIPLDLLVSSGPVTVDPITCSELAAENCGAPGRGVAVVSGSPTALVGPVMAVKLAGAAYRSQEPLLGASIEMALEGSLYASPEIQEGEPCSLRLFLAESPKLIGWAAERDALASRRSYKNKTGAGAVLSDSRILLFPGWLRGRVVRNDGVSILVDFDEADISPVRVGDETQTWIAPDLAAAAAGLPAGVFARLQVNYTGFAGPSYVLEGAVSNDVELHATAVPQAAIFLRGDCDGDGSVQGAVTDALTLLRFSFLGGEAPPCLAACDADGDGKATSNVVDAIYLLRHAFLGGPPPPPPYPRCGPADSQALGCETQAPCP